MIFFKLAEEIENENGLKIILIIDIVITKVQGQNICADAPHQAFTNQTIFAVICK